jgi:hypothetical protein
MSSIVGGGCKTVAETASSDAAAYDTTNVIGCE